MYCKTYKLACEQAQANADYSRKAWEVFLDHNGRYRAEPLNVSNEKYKDVFYPKTANLPTRLDQGLEGYTPTLVREARSLLEGVSMPCGYHGCSYCDPENAYYGDERDDR